MKLSSNGKGINRRDGVKKEEFRTTILDNIQKDFAEKGILIDNIYFVGDFILPQTIINRIDSKIAATQEAIQKENELRITQAEAQKQIEAAKGEALSAIEKAKGLADAILIEAEAQAQANKLINNTITNNLINLRKIEKWDGKLPHVTGNDGGGLILNLQ